MSVSIFGWVIHQIVVYKVKQKVYNNIDRKGGDNLRKISLAAARVNAGLTQEQLKKTIGVSKNILIDWEKGRKHPTMEQLEKYCKACGCSVSDVDCKVLILKKV